MNEDLGTDESKTDTFVDYILREIGLAEYPLILKLKPMYDNKTQDDIICTRLFYRKRELSSTNRGG